MRTIYTVFLFLWNRSFMLKYDFVLVKIFPVELSCSLFNYLILSIKAYAHVKWWTVFCIISVHTPLEYETASKRENSVLEISEKYSKRNAPVSTSIFCLIYYRYTLIDIIIPKYILSLKIAFSLKKGSKRHFYLNITIIISIFCTLTIKFMLFQFYFFTSNWIHFVRHNKLHTDTKGEIILITNQKGKRSKKAEKKKQKKSVSFFIIFIWERKIKFSQYLDLFVHELI